MNLFIFCYANAEQIQTYLKISQNILHIYLHNIKIRNSLKTMSARCVFQSSKHYRNAFADAEQIAQPLGDKFINSSGASAQIHHQAKKGDLVIRHLYDKNNHQILSQRRMIFEKLEEMFKLSELPNKADYVSQACLDFIRKQIDEETLVDLEQKFMPNPKQGFSMVELAQLVHNPKVDSLFHIQNWALSKVTLFCEGSDEYKLHYLWDLVNRRIIDYPVDLQVVDRSDKKYQIKNKVPCAQFIDPASFNYKSGSQVEEFIKKINQNNLKKDPLYSGVHLYFGDYVQKTAGRKEYFQRQIEHLYMLQYYITVLTGILGDGQTAILKLNGSFRHKTFQFLFLLKLVFVKVSLSKTYGSNPFIPDSYVICEYYNKRNGDFVHQQLINNYQVLSDYGEEKLLIDPKRIFKEDCHNALTRFNDQIIFMGLQSVIKDYRANSNAEYYPNKLKTKSSLPQHFCIKLEDLVDESIKQKPQKIEEAKKQQHKVQKEADYEMLSAFNFTKKVQPAKKPENQASQKKKEANDGKTQVERYLQAQERRKQQENRKKPKKNNKKSSWDRDRGVY